MLMHDPPENPGEVLNWNCEFLPEPLGLHGNCRRCQGVGRQPKNAIYGS